MKMKNQFFNHDAQNGIWYNEYTQEGIMLEPNAEVAVGANIIAGKRTGTNLERMHWMMWPCNKKRGGAAVHGHGHGGEDDEEGEEHHEEGGEGEDHEKGKDHHDEEKDKDQEGEHHDEEDSEEGSGDSNDNSEAA